VQAVRTWLSYDDVEGLEAAARTPAAHRQAAAELTAWADEQHPDDEVSPADLLSAAAWHLQQAGDTEPALELYRRAVAAEGTTTPDARCLLSAALLEAGRLNEARQVADGLRRSGPRIVDVASMAEVFELHGDLKEAHRWVAMGVTRLELASESELPEEYEVDELLSVRRRVRQALGFPPDDLDEIGR
jgi:tetratricopeptide (TPR) repeat protein